MNQGEKWRETIRKAAEAGWGASLCKDDSVILSFDDGSELKLSAGYCGEHSDSPSKPEKEWLHILGDLAALLIIMGLAGWAGWQAATSVQATKPEVHTTIAPEPTGRVLLDWCRHHPVGKSWVTPVAYQDQQFGLLCVKFPPKEAKDERLPTPNSHG